MTELLTWGVEALVASALLMLAVLALRGPVRRLFGAEVAYALWALPALRLSLPPLPAHWREQVATPIVRAGEAVTVLIVPVGTPSVAAAAPLPWAAIIGMVWASGAASFLAFHLSRHRRFRRRLLRDARLLDEISGVRVIESPGASGPLAFGITRRFVAFPPGFAQRYDPDERTLALAHELGHHARRDLLANWIGLGVLALHWFSPLAWHAFRAFRCDQELANDARVLAGRSRADRHIYACAIVKAVGGASLSPVCHFHTIVDVKRRLRMLTTRSASRARTHTGRGFVAVLAAAGLGLTASPGTAARVGAHFADALPQAAPLPPAPPAPPAPPMIGKPATANGGREQVRTIVVKPDGQGAYMLLVKGVSVAPRSSLPGDATLPSDFALPRDCEGGNPTTPFAYVIKGQNGNRTYTVLCTRAGGAATSAGGGASTNHEAYEQALAGLRDLRANVQSQTQPGFPEQERRHALAAIDSSIAEVTADLATAR